VHADLFDEQAEEFLRLFRAFGGKELAELVGEAGEGGRVGRRVRLCGEPVGEVGWVDAVAVEPAPGRSDRTEPGQAVGQASASRLRILSPSR
jgi:hypothetical protein